MRNLVALVLAVIITSLGTFDPAEAARLSGQHNGAKAKHSYSVVRDFSRAGKRSQRFEVRAGDCQYDRSWSKCGFGNEPERSEYETKKRWGYGKNQWIGFSVYLPSDFQLSKRTETVVGRINISGVTNPLLHLEMRGNSYYMRVWGQTGNHLKDFPLARVSEMRGRWTDIAVHFDTSEGKQVLEAFVNRKPKMKLKNWREFSRPEFSFTYGILRIFVSRHGGPMPTQVLFIDEARMGRSPGRVIVNEERPVD